MEANWREKTLEELEEMAWNEPDFASDREQKTYALRKTPLARFTAEDVRILISQRISLAYLVPVAVEKLRQNLFVEGDFYPGDLLQSVLAIDEVFWMNNRPLWQQVFELIRHRMWELEERYINAEPFLELS
jgi:hypothetical protein